MARRREIRNSTAEFLIFQIEGKEQGVEVYYKNKTVWCTQKAMGMLFDCTSDNISVHLQNIYDTAELKKEATTEKISVVRREGNRDVNRDAPTTRLFFKMMQNKTMVSTNRLHYAVHGRTAAELIVERADAEQEHMGLTTWENAPDGKIVKTDVSIAKNYLKEMELADMGQLVNGVLELAERMAKRHIPMTMEDWTKQIDIILAAGGNEVLQTAGSVSAEEAKEHAETEFEKYRIVQDRLFQSDFDKYLGELPFDGE